MIRNKFEEQVDWEYQQRNKQAVSPLRSSQTILVHLHEESEELGADHLEDSNDRPDDQESWIGEDALENVKLVVDFSG